MLLFGFFTLLVLWNGAVLAAGASSQRNVNPTGGTAADGSNGLRWLLGSNSQFQVYLGGQGQVYEPGNTPSSGRIYNSVYLRVDRGSNASTRVYTGSNYRTSAGNTDGGVMFTQVSQTSISGAGTSTSPWQVTTVLRPSVSVDSGITVTIVDRYVHPEAWLTRRVTLSGMPTSGADIKLYQHVDSYLSGNDEGPGFARRSAWNSGVVPDLVGVQKQERFQALWYVPSSGTPHWDRYSSEMFYYPVWQMCHGGNTPGGCRTGAGNLSNNANPDPTQDHGMAVQWNVPRGQSTFTVEYRITFGMNPVDLTKSFSPDTIPSGGVSTLTFNLTNRSTNSVSGINFTDTLPPEIQVAATPNIRTNCPAGGALGGTLPSGMSVSASGNVIRLIGGRVNGAASVSSMRACQVTVDVTSSIVGTHHNTNTNISNLSNLLNLVGDETLTVEEAPAPPPDFGTCDARMFLSEGANTNLWEIDAGTSPFTTTMLGTGSIRYNGTGYNPLDNYLYAMRYNAPSNEILRVGSDGSTQNLGPVAGLPALYYNSGAVSAAGIYYVRGTATGNGPSSQLYAIDLATLSATTINLDTAITTSDIAFVGSTLYTVSDAGQLYAIHVSSGSVQAIGAAVSGPIFGAQFGAPNGLFGAANNGAGFFRIDLATGARMRVSDGMSAGNNDGANCPTAEITFPANLWISKTNTPSEGPNDLPDDTVLSGTQTTYRIVVGNDGPFPVSGAVLKDPLGNGLIECLLATPVCTTGGTATCPTEGTGPGQLSIDNLQGPDGVLIPELGAGGSVTINLTCTVE